MGPSIDAGASSRPGFFREGLRELRRRVDRFKLRRRLRKQKLQLDGALARLGRRAWEEKLDRASFGELHDQLDGLQGRAGEVTSATQAFESEKATLEEKRRAQVAELDARRRQAGEQKQAVDAALREARRKRTELERRSQHLEARLAALPAELAKVEQELGALEAGSAPDRQTRLEAARAHQQALHDEQTRLAAERPAVAEALPPLASEVARLEEESRKGAAEVSSIDAERRATLGTTDAELARLRNQIQASQREAAGVETQREELFTSLGSAVFERGTAPAALSESLREVTALDGARGSTEAEIEASLATSRAMPRRTMAKFFAAALLVPGALFALGVGARSGWDLVRPPEGEERRAGTPDEELRAEPGGPYEVERAAVVKLDGSRSRGRISRYEWTFGGAGSGPSVKEGVTTTAQVLDTVSVTLTVYGVNRSDSKSTTITVRPRRGAEWETKFRHTGSSDLTGESLTAGSLQLRQLRFGRNICAVGKTECDDIPGDYIHRKHDESEWRETAYELKQVLDPGGPFDTWWYVVTPDFKVERKSCINADLRRNGKIHQTNQKADKALKKKVSDFETLMKQVAEHEKMHSTLLKETLRQKDFDPAKKAEASFAPIEQAAQERVEFHIREAETQLGMATEEARVAERLKKEFPEFNRSGSVLLPVAQGSDEYESYAIPNFAELGHSVGGHE